MRLSLFVFWAIVGWCITGVRIWWWHGPIPIDTPEPVPHPNWLVLRIIGVVGGIIGGWVFMRVFGPQPEPWSVAGPGPQPWAMVVFAAATSVGAFLGASLLTDLYGLVRGNRTMTRG